MCIRGLIMLHDKGHLSANGAVIDVEPWFLQKLEVKSWLASRAGRGDAGPAPTRAPPAAPPGGGAPREVAVRSPQVRPDEGTGAASLPRSACLRPKCHTLFLH